MFNNIPTGSVTFLFTDIEGSTKLSQEFPDTLPAALEVHNAILRDAIESNNGFVFKNTGDGFCASFENASDAVKAAFDAQLGIANEKWTDAVIKVRMGVHSGNAEWNGKMYMGYITLARAARVMSTAYGEQIIISNDTYEMLFNNNLKDPKTLSFLNMDSSSLIDFEAENKNEISFRDLGDRRLKDVIKPIKLFQVNAPGLRKDFPPLKTLDARPNNLPVQLTSFIGREKELKQVKDLLSQTHLLTLLGSGGAGKSRLSLQTGADVIDDFANGVWFVELAAVSEPKLLIQTVMSAIGILENPKESPEATLTGYLKDREILIILDNCEHMIDVCAEFTENLLSICPKLKVMSTSREALKSSGEQIYKIPSLSHPNPEVKDTPEQLIQYESVRLFIERALAVNTEFRVTIENTPALAEICSRLDGIPLAIELAAARTKIMSVEKIHERLDDRFRLLTGGKRTALPRQQTLRSLIDWSYDLLSENEKILWNRLSVFRSGWILEAAEDICSDDILDKYEIIEYLQNLSEKSIIIFDNANERYRMLETIRQYGNEKLLNAGEHSNISEKHLKYYTELAETADLKLQGPEIVKWLKILDEEKGNLEMGLKFSGDTGDINKEAGLAGALGYYWEIRGQFTEGILRFQKIHLNIPETMNACFTKILLLIGIFEYNKGEIEKAEKVLQECHDLYINLNDKKGIGSSLNFLGHILKVKGEYEQAVGFFKKSLSISRDTGDKIGTANSLNNLGIISFDKSDFGKSTDLFEESLSISRVTGDKRGIAKCLSNLGIVSIKKRKYDKAVDLIEESLLIRRDTGDKRGIAICLSNLGIIFINKEEFDKATDLYEESLTICHDIGDKRGIAGSLNNLGFMSLEKKEYDKADGLFQKSLSISRDIGDKTGIANSLIGLGKISFFKKEYDKAKEFYQESLSQCIILGNKYEIAQNFIRLIDVHIKLKSDLPLTKLLGFIKEFSESHNYIFTESDQKVFDDSVMYLKKNMTDDEYLKSFEKGRSMTPEEAVDLIFFKK
ncbi:MAG: tetratricopeptide repeat protein [Ignavibacteria bacterium]